MRRAVLMVALAGLLLATGARSAGAADRFSLQVAGTSSFPQRSFRLAVPDRVGLRLGDTRVTENGEPVSKLALTSADGGQVGAFGSVLVIDTSSSMHGSAIRGAMDAARVLARQRRGAQQFGVILFNQSSEVLLPPTSDPAAIDAALRGLPRLAPQTHLYDAVDRALTVLRTSGITAGSIVVLSDGADTGSTVRSSAVVRRAKEARVPIYTVGLRSGATNSGQLERLAAAARGRYSAADSVGDLRRIFRDIGSELSANYLISYRSMARAGSEVTVAVRVAGVPGVATSTYRVPGGASYVQVRSSVWTSTLGLLITGGVFALLVGLSLGVLLARRHRRPTLRQRVHDFSSAHDGDPSGDDIVALAGGGAGRSAGTLSRWRWWVAFQHDVEIARISMTPARIVQATLVATAVVMGILVAATGIVLVGLFALIVPWAVRMVVRLRLSRQRTLFNDQLPDVLQGSASAIRAGHGLVAALSIVAEDAAEPTRTEFRQVVSDEALGVPLEDALRTVQRRMDSRAVLQIALVAQIQREAGGNMAEVLDRITDSLRQTSELRRMVTALTAQGRLSRWVVTALPLVLLLGVTIANPAYVNPLFTTPLGVTMLALVGVMMVAGSLIIGKIVDFKV